LKSKLLVRKDYENYTSNVMIKGNLIIDLSNSVANTPNLTIDKQSKYLEKTFASNINHPEPETKTKFFKVPSSIKPNKNKSVIGANKDWNNNIDFENERNNKKYNISLFDELSMVDDPNELIEYLNLISNKLGKILNKN